MTDTPYDPGQPIDWDAELKDMEQGTRPIPVGAYPFKITAAEVRSARTGSPMIVITAAVDDNGPFHGRLVFSNLVFKFSNPIAMKRTVGQLQMLGVSPEELRSARPSLGQIASKLLGARSMGDITHREWKGDIQMDVRFTPGTAPLMGVPSAMTGAVAPPPVTPPPPPLTQAPPAPETPPPPPLPEADSSDPF